MAPLDEVAHLRPFRSIQSSTRVFLASYEANQRELDVKDSRCFLPPTTVSIEHY